MFRGEEEGGGLGADGGGGEEQAPAPPLLPPMPVLPKHHCSPFQWRCLSFFPDLQIKEVFEQLRAGK